MDGSLLDTLDRVIEESQKTVELTDDCMARLRQYHEEQLEKIREFLESRRTK